MVRKDIDLNNPQLGSELLKNPKGDLPLDVWLSFCPKVIWDVPLLNWHVNPPKRIDPQAVDEAFTWAVQALVLRTETQFYLPATFPTQDSAIEAAIHAGRRKIDVDFERGSEVVKG